MSYSFRNAVPEDAPTCVAVRGKTRENSFSVEQLKSIGVTVDTWREGIKDGSFPGYVSVPVPASIAGGVPAGIGAVNYELTIDSAAPWVVASSAAHAAKLLQDFAAKLARVSRRDG